MPSAQGEIWVVADDADATPTWTAQAPFRHVVWPPPAGHHDVHGVLLPYPFAVEPRALRERLGAEAVVVVVLGGDAPREVARRALTLGADGVIAASDLQRQLDAALDAAHHGLLVVSAAFTAALEDPPLTPREKQVLALVVMGFTNREIADQLVLAESTVKSHLFAAFRRLGVRTRSEAVRLITDPSRGLGSGILGIPES